MKIVIVGDSIADKYVYVRAKKLCPEGPVPVVEYLGEMIQPGGALNVFYNVKETQSDTFIVTFVGDDPPGGHISTGVYHQQGLIEVSGMRTPTKVRFYEENHLFLRVDKERENQPISEGYRKLFLEALHHYLKFADGVIISDYGKGAINADVMVLIRNHEKPVFLDPYPDHYRLYELLDHYHIKLITPNQKEYLHLKELGSSLIKEEVPTIITRGPQGATLLHLGVAKNEKAITSYPVCVTGAGDVLLAYASVAILRGTTYNAALRMGNYAAGIAIQSRGNAICPLSKLRKDFRSLIQPRRGT